jgi:LPXTG-motif cell wall-anchored protein
VNHNLISLAALSGLIVLSPFAKADEWDKRTVITFNEPVEIPGMVLPAGTYVMKLLDSPSDRDVVQFFNKTETRIFDTVMTIPTYRETPADHTVITFEERLASAPQAVKDWYYPGDLRGEEFVYPKARPMMTAQATSPPLRPVYPEAKPAPTPAQAMTPKPAPAPAQPVQMAQATPAQTPAPAPAPARATEPVQKAANTLPKTGSDLPLAGLLGLLSVSGGLVLRRRRT